jgi:hypothetical protein
MCDLRSDPCEYSVDYKDFAPPRQRPATFSIDQIIEKLEAATARN